MSSDVSSETQYDGKNSLDALRELALRLLGGPPGLEIEREALFVRELPPDLPIALPWPEEARIVGCYSVCRRYSSGYGSESWRILYQCNLSPEQISEFYNQRLLQGGWMAADRQFGGFSPNWTPIPDYRQFAHRELQFGLTLHTEVSGNVTHVSLDLRNDLHPEGQPRSSYEPIIPELAPMGGMSGSAGNRYAHSASLIDAAYGENTPVELAMQFYPQLENAGWVLTQETRVPELLESSWSFRDALGSLWRGTLTIAQLPEKINQCYVLVEAERDELNEVEKQLRVLIATDDFTVARNIRRLFQFEPDLRTIGPVAYGESTIRMIEEDHPDIVLVIPSSTSKLRVEDIADLSIRLPSIEVVILLPENEFFTHWSSLPNAVKAVLVIPHAADHLLESIRYSANPDRREVRTYNVARVDTVKQSLSLTHENFQAAINSLTHQGLINSYHDDDHREWLVVTRQGHETLFTSETDLSAHEHEVLTAIHQPNAPIGDTA